MKNLKDTVLKGLAHVALNAAQKSANSACPAFHYQGKMPVEIKKLRKF